MDETLTPGKEWMERNFGKDTIGRDDERVFDTVDERAIQVARALDAAGTRWTTVEMTIAIGNVTVTSRIERES